MYYTFSRGSNIVVNLTEEEVDDFFQKYYIEDLLGYRTSNTLKQKIKATQATSKMETDLQDVIKNVRKYIGEQSSTPVELPDEEQIEFLRYAAGYSDDDSYEDSDDEEYTGDISD